MTEPRKYAKKSIIVEAIQWTGANYLIAKSFCPDLAPDDLGGEQSLAIRDKDGFHLIGPGCWIIKLSPGVYETVSNKTFIEDYDKI